MRHRGFTLLEVILALSLTSFVLAAVAFAIDVNLRMVSACRVKVEEAQLARALLQKIASDLRNAVVSRPDEGEQSGSETPSEEGSPPEDAPSSESTGTEATEIVSEAGYPRAVPGLYGEIDWLQVDVSRLPRLDQYQYELVPAEDALVTDRVSGVKTVAYYLAASAGLTGVTSVTTTDVVTDSAGITSNPSGGLVRRELDREVSAWAEEQGLLTDVEQNLEPIAPEVSAIEFTYCDGTQWLDYWDTEEMGSLPVAVQIALTLTAAPTNTQSSSFFNWLPGNSTAGMPESTTYYLTVNLPVAAPASSEESTEMTEDTATSSESEP